MGRTQRADCRFVIWHESGTQDCHGNIGNLRCEPERTQDVENNLTGRAL
jgi:hypothetical protein